MILIMLPSLFDSLQSIPGRWQRIEAGGILFSRSEPVRSMYCLSTGEVHLSRTTIDGSEVVMQRCIDGMIIADASLFAATYHCDAHAVTTSSVYCIAKRTFKRHLSQSNDLLLDWCSSLSSEIQALRMRNEILRMRTVCERLDAWLLWQNTSLPPKGQWMSIAHEIGVSPEALYREIARRT